MNRHTDRIQIQVNGEVQQASTGDELLDLIGSLSLPVTGILIEHNGTALLRSEWAATRLADGDRLEILRVVAGG